MPDDSALLTELEAICAQAGVLALEGREQLKSELKDDGSIVTNADRLVEKFIRKELARLTPNIPIWGEEFGYEEANENGLWVIDPIDGTSNFSYGLPLWGVTVALLRDNVIQLGCIQAPELGWSLCGRRGGGATMNGEPLAPIRPGGIERHELVGYGDAKMMCDLPKMGRKRHIGAFVIEAGFFITGGVRIVLASRVRLYDAAAAIVIARELGAEIRELNGDVWDEAEWMKPSRCRMFGFFPKDTDWPFDESYSK